ncbi:HAD hydrolase-like protein [Shigella flexneri]
MVFDDVLICPHRPYRECRKPKTQLVTAWLANEVMDTANSYVIGDRATDLELATQHGYYRPAL